MMKFQEEIELIARREGKVLGRWTSKNVITDEGLARLRTHALSGVAGSLGLTTREVVPLSTHDGHLYVQPVHQESCGGSLVGMQPPTQNSWLQGWSNFEQEELNTVASDFTWREWGQKWIIQPEVHFADKASQLSGAESGGAGGIKTGISNFAIGSGFARLQSSFIVGCVEPPNNPPQAQRLYHANFPLWSHGQFKVEDVPVELNFVDGTFFDFYYTIRLMVPHEPVVTVEDIFGVETTVTTRAYAVHIEQNWGPRWMGPLAIAPAQAYETDVMPALDALMGGGNSPSQNAILSTVGNSHRAEFVWATGNANFATGIGAITHGHRVGAVQPLMISTFSPKIAKTNIQKLTFTGTYGWDRV